MRELLATARKLLEGSPTDSDVRRAVSTSYHALYHYLSRCCCEQIVRDETLGSANYQIYRSVEHGLARAACLESREPGKGFPAGIVEYARIFMLLQARRNAADYDPTAQFNSFAAPNLILVAERAITVFDVVPERHRRAFAVLVAIRKRGRG